jgi:hypothetical protein
MQKCACLPSGNAGIAISRIVWLMTNRSFLSDILCETRRMLNMGLEMTTSALKHTHLVRSNTNNLYLPKLSTTIFIGFHTEHTPY